MFFSWFAIPVCIYQISHLFKCYSHFLDTLIFPLHTGWRYLLLSKSLWLYYNYYQLRAGLKFFFTFPNLYQTLKFRLHESHSRNQLNGTNHSDWKVWHIQFSNNIYIKVFCTLWNTDYKHSSVPFTKLSFQCFSKYYSGQKGMRLFF